MSFRERDEHIKRIGFPDYGTYLKTELWSSIRGRVLRASGGQCCGCENRASEVHHSEYTIDNILGKSLEGLHPVCSDCHELIHLNAVVFVSLAESKTRVEIFRKARKHDTPDVKSPGGGMYSVPKKPSIKDKTMTCDECGKEKPEKSMWGGRCKVCRNRKERAEAR